MTSFAIPAGLHSQQLADAFTRVIPRLDSDHDAVIAACGLRVAASPDNQATVAPDVPWAIRPRLAQVMREVADGGQLADGTAGQLRGLADGLDASVAARNLNSR
jgi:hypothetical protein